MVDRVAQPVPSAPVVNGNGEMENAFQLFTQKLALRALIIGSGNPNTVVDAEQGALYMDESASTGDVLYIKRVADVGGDKSQGWRAV